MVEDGGVIPQQSSNSDTMNIRILTSTAILALALITTSGTAHAQGSLTPPAGAPAPSSHTLNEVYDKATSIEGQSTAQGTKIDAVQTQVNNLGARKPLITGTPGVLITANGTINISLPGSYYLTANKLITSTGAHGIAITCTDVTLDLNGFALQCGSGTGGSAIYLNDVAGARQIHIRNGFIRGGSRWVSPTFTPAGWTNGISGAAKDVTISDVTITGMRGYGIDCGDATVSNCRVSDCGIMGIRAAGATGCRAMRCVEHGLAITGSVTRCEGESVGTGHGIGGANVLDSSGSSESNSGINAVTVSHSNGSSYSGTGISTHTASDCYASSFSGVAINAKVATNCACNNHSATNSCMVSKTASYCAVKNTAGGKALMADIAIGCTSEAGVIQAAQKHLGTP